MKRIQRPGVEHLEIRREYAGGAQHHLYVYLVQRQPEHVRPAAGKGEPAPGQDLRHQRFRFRFSGKSFKQIENEVGIQLRQFCLG